ncbi:hypothetical protein DRO27_03035 [Candidatus Bathyarchaeota archaeon]|nr:MAG: hypothetical protein DRO27_03035 [Candidatus Bathyarchaeota archaeon]
MKKIGFDTQKYLDAQVKRIIERVALFDKLYLEFGGKLRFDNHASRVLPGFQVDTKIKMLKKLGDDLEIIHCISAKDIDRRKVRRDFGLTYEDQILKDINDLGELGLAVSAVIINRFNGEQSALKFKQRLENRSIRVFIAYEIPNYLEDIDLVVSDEGYGKPEWVPTEKKIIVVTAPGPNSGKMSFAMSQVYQDRKRGIMSGFAKFETFPIWDLPVEHPVNIAYEAATADLGDYNCIDPWHLKAYGEESTNYNRDVENFVIMERIIERMVPDGDPMTEIKSPTDMGVNMANQGIIDDDVIQVASRQEVLRRYYQYKREYVEGNTTFDTMERMEKIMERVGVKPEDRDVATAANKAMEISKEAEDKGSNGLYSGAAIEIWMNNKPVIVTGKRSPILHSESAALLNAVKFLSGVPDEIDVLSPIIIESIRKLKISMGLSDVSLDVREVLDALAVSAVFNPNAAECLDELPALKNCEWHSTHIMDPGCEQPLKELGLNITTDAIIPRVNST